MTPHPLRPAAPAPDIAKLPEPALRARRWRIKFATGALVELPMAKLISADASWVRFYNSDGLGVLFASAHIIALEELPNDG